MSPEETTLPGARRSFVAPDFARPLDLKAELARIPADATTKGLYFQSLNRLAAEHGITVPSRTYVSLLDYPNRAYSELAYDVATSLYPDEPVREALRRVGQTAFPALRSSFVGRAVFGVFGDNLPPLFRLVSRAWEMSTSHVRAYLIDGGPGEAIVEVTSCHAFIDCFVVGIFEGIILDRGLLADVAIDLRTPVDAVFRCRWTAPPSA